MKTGVPNYTRRKVAAMILQCHGRISSSTQAEQAAEVLVHELAPNTAAPCRAAAAPDLRNAPGSSSPRLSEEAHRRTRCTMATAPFLYATLAPPVYLRRYFGSTHFFSIVDAATADSRAISRRYKRRTMLVPVTPASVKRSL
jgi:hypothetical protein